MNNNQIKFNKALFGAGRAAKDIMDRFYEALFDENFDGDPFTKFNTEWVNWTSDWNKKHPDVRIDPIDFYRFAIDQKI